MDQVQLNFLQLLSSEASQQFTLGCYNTIGYYNNRNATSDKAVKFLTADDKELSPHGSPKFFYNVLSDSCQVRPYDSIRLHWSVCLRIMFAFRVLQRALIITYQYVICAA